MMRVRLGKTGLLLLIGCIGILGGCLEQSDTVVVDAQASGGSGPISGQPPVGSATLSAVISATPTSGVASLSVVVDASQSTSPGVITSYTWNFGDGTIVEAESTSHVYTQPGSYTVTLSVSDDQGSTDSASTTINVSEFVDNGQGTVPTGVLFYDNFEYNVSRSTQYTREGSPFVSSGGWAAVKSENISGEANRAHGYLYTVSEIPGYSGNFPGRDSNSVLAMEARPASMGGQTDFFLQYGTGSVPETVPGNVWFQFWVYSNRYDDPTNQNDQLSAYDGRFKFIYPCNIQYPCVAGNKRWKTMMGTSSVQPEWAQGGSTELFVSMMDMDHFARYLPSPDWDEFKLGQQDTSERIVPNRWTLVKIHFDTSVAQGQFEAWLKPMGGQWTKVAEWIDGETADFVWNVTAENIGGHRMFRMPTTMDAYDSWLYLDDFAMATSEADLPVYPY
jgi:PKD repeat protein